MLCCAACVATSINASSVIHVRPGWHGIGGSITDAHADPEWQVDAPHAASSRPKDTESSSPHACTWAGPPSRHQQPATQTNLFRSTNNRQVRIPTPRRHDRHASCVIRAEGVMVLAYRVPLSWPWGRGQQQAVSMPRLCSSTPQAPCACPWAVRRPPMVGTHQDGGEPGHTIHEG